VFLVKSVLIVIQAEAIKKSHVVQSHRGLIERMFACLKKWDILFGGHVDSINTSEMELDCAMALQNLLEMERLKLLDLIPARPRFAPDSHITTPKTDPSMQYPAAVKLESPKVPVHVREFHAEMTSTVTGKWSWRSRPCNSFFFNKSKSRPDGSAWAATLSTNGSTTTTSLFFSPSSSRTASRLLDW
jgi:hypothetical protein